MDEQNQQPSQPPQQPTIPLQNVSLVPPPQHKNWIKWVLILVGILIIVGVAGGAYYLGRQKNNPQPASPKITQTSSFKPEDVVKTFYNTWLNCEKEFDKYALKMDKVPPEISQQREECIKKAINDYTIVRKEHPTDNSMWCAQDFPLKVEVDKATITNQTATALSHHFFEQSGDNQIKVTLTLIDNVWKISGTTCLNSTQSDETANWKTVEGLHSTVEESPYSFQYPETWISETDTIGDPLKKYLFFESGKILITKDLQLSNSNPQTVLKGAYIDTFGQSNIFESNKSFDQNLADFDSNPSFSKFPLIKEERFVLDGQPARKRIGKLGNDGYVEVVFEYPQNKGYMYITLRSSLNDLEQNQIIFDQILSTFRFD